MAVSPGEAWTTAVTTHREAMQGVGRKDGRSDESFMSVFKDGPPYTHINDRKDGSWGPLRELTAQYGVARSLNGKNVPEGFREEFYVHVVKVTQSWDDSGLAAKARKLLTSLPRLPGKKGSGKGPVSAASKLAWFTSQKDWSLFDSRAANTIGERDFVRFYEILENLGFETFCVDVQSVLNEYGFHNLLAERVVDGLLYSLGAEKNKPRDLDAVDQKIGEAIARLTAVSDVNRYLRYRCLMK